MTPESSPRRRNGALPTGVVAALDRGDVSAAGELLRDHGERLARSTPARARAWVARLQRVVERHDALRPWVQWTAATVWYLLGDAARAEPLLAAAARSFTARRRRDLADRVGLTQVDLHGERLQLGRARRLARALERRFKAAGDRERAAVALANLAAAEDAADRVGAARQLWFRALRDLDPCGVRRLLVTANLANTESLVGSFGAAAAGHRRVAKRAAELGLVAVALQAELNLAETELARGEVDTAAQRWLETAERARAAGLPLVAAGCEVELGRVDLELGREESAARRLEAVLPELEQLGLDLEQARAWRLLVVAEAARRSPDPVRLERARAALRGRGLGAQRDLLEVDMALVGVGSGPRRTAAAARRLAGRGLRHRGELGLALAAIQEVESGAARRGLARARRVLAERSPSPWTRMLAHHACARALPGASADGLGHSRQAVRAADRLHGRLGSSADRIAFLRRRGDVYADLIWRLLERDGPEDRRRCLDLLSTLKSGWLLDELARRSDRGSDRIVRRWQSLRRQLATHLEHSEGGDEPRVRHLGLAAQRELVRLESRLEDVEADLRRTRPALAPVGPGVAAALARMLPPNHLYLEYLLGDEDLVVFALERGRLQVHRQRGAAPEVRRLAASVRFHLDADPWADETSRSARRSSLEARLRRLGWLLLAPARASTGWKVLWVAPDRGLYHLPWTALELDGGQLLVDRGAVTLVPGASVAGGLLASEHRPPKSAALAGSAGVGLDLVEPEIRALARLLPHAVVRPAASRADVVDLLAHHDMVHLAGHALFVDGAAGASGLKLEDGYLTVHDLAATPMAARLVSFGVCSGVRVADGERYRFDGFLRALLGSGVRSVVGPVAWVRDPLAHAFALAFHDRLRKADGPAEAFRQAIGQLREADPHPAAWGSFQLFGDGRPWRKA